MTEAVSLQDVVARVERALDPIFVTAEHVRTALLSVWSRHVDGDGKISSRDLAELQPVLLAELEAHPSYLGTGFIAAPGALSDAPRFLEWWQQARGDQHAPTRLIVNLDPAAPEPYDYLEMDWFLDAREGWRSVMGPYLDYAGADRFILTFTVPVDIQGTFVGVTGVDIAMQAVEPVFARALGPSAEDLVIVNRHGRVVVSNTAMLAPAERFRAAPSDAGEPIGGPGVAWRVHALER